MKKLKPVNIKSKVIIEIGKGNMNLHEIEIEFKPLHDRLVLWCNFLLAFIAKNMGEEAVGEAMGKLVEDLYKEGFLELKKMTPKERFELLCRSHRSNFSKFETEENDQNYTIVIKYCGSGGLIKKEGSDRKYGAITSRAYPWSFGEAGIPYYCTHASCFNDLFRKLGLKIEVRYGDPCRYIVYK